MKYASISTSASGDTTIVSAVTAYNKKIRVIAYTIIASGDVSVKFKSGSNDISGAMAIATNGGISAAAGVMTAFGPLGLLETNSGEALVINLSSATQVSGHLTYVLVD